MLTLMANFQSYPLLNNNCMTIIQPFCSMISDSVRVVGRASGVVTLCDHEGRLTAETAWYGMRIQGEMALNINPD